MFTTTREYISENMYNFICNNSNDDNQEPRETNTLYISTYWKSVLSAITWEFR